MFLTARLTAANRSVEGVAPGICRHEPFARCTMESVFEDEGLDSLDVK